MDFRAEKRSHDYLDLDYDLYEDHQPIAKKPSNNFEMYSDISQRMMAKMGYKAESGLGKNEQGRREIIEPTIKQNRCGLGLNNTWIETMVSKGDLKQTPEWFSGTGVCQLTTTASMPFAEIELTDWVQSGPPKKTIADETEFCDAGVLEQMLAAKTALDHISLADLTDGRPRSNPFECIGKSMFMNRAAVKMAHLDSITDFMFTNPRTASGESLVTENELLYFADVCAGPGGFSEYVLWRKNWHAKGFGFTLKESCDFRMHEFRAGPPEAFEPHYGAADDGNIYNPENILSFNKHVLENTEMYGVHFLMADGGFSADGKENIQEILSKQLYLCQCLMALCCVRESGHFVTKLFDTFTPFSVGLIYLMSQCFAQIAIVKPYSSRPASSERYLVCKWRAHNVKPVRDHLYDLNEFMWTNRNENIDMDVLQLVPVPVIKANPEFYNYICERNNTIGQNQVAALRKLIAFSQDRTLRQQHDQLAIQKHALQVMRIPNEARRNPAKISIEATFTRLIGDWYSQKEFLSAREGLLGHREQVTPLLNDVDGWHFVPIEATEAGAQNVRAIFMSRGNGDLLQYTERKTWSPMDGIRVQLPRDTLVYAEIVRELSGEGKSQIGRKALHIIDAIVLGGEDIRHKPLRQRLQLCEKFVRAINRSHTTKSDGTPVMLAPIRCKPIIQLANVRQFFDGLRSYKLKDGNIRLGATTSGPTEQHRFYVPRGLLMFNEIKPNLRRGFDHRQQRTYFIDLSQNNNCFLAENLKNPDSIYGSFKSTFASRHLWKWDLITQVQPECAEKRTDTLVYRSDLEQLIYSKQMERQLN